MQKKWRFYTNDNPCNPCGCIYIYIVTLQIASVVIDIKAYYIYVIFRMQNERLCKYDMLFAVFLINFQSIEGEFIYV